jgi:hypothetical protein
MPYEIGNLIVTKNGGYVGRIESIEEEKYYNTVIKIYHVRQVMNGPRLLKHGSIQSFVGDNRFTIFTSDAMDKRIKFHEKAVEQLRKAKKTIFP